jgi:hypothetical protein
MSNPTDVEGIVSIQRGVLINTIQDDYKIKLEIAKNDLRRKQELESRINSIENDVSSIKDMLTEILRKI